MPYQSGGMDRDRRISRAGNPRARTTMIQLAWLWLRYQPGSDLAKWFRDRDADGRYAADRDRGDGSQIADCALALCRRRGGAGRRRYPCGGRNRSIDKQELPLTILWSAAIRGVRPSSSLAVRSCRVSGGSRLAGATPRARGILVRAIVVARPYVR